MTVNVIHSVMTVWVSIAFLGSNSSAGIMQPLNDAVIKYLIKWKNAHYIVKKAR